MKLRRKVGLVAAIFASIGLLSVAQAKGRYTTGNGMGVVSDASDPARFDVLQLAGRGASDYWCAAGYYAIVAMGVPKNTRIYLVQPLGRGRLNRNSIGFSVNPDISVSGSGTSRVIMSMKQVGQNWSAEHARTQCPDRGNNR